jgi:hypothetical protein
MSFDFSKALSVPKCLILSTKHELNIWTPCGTSLSIITTKTPFSSSLLISLHHESVNRASCIKTDISIYRDCFTDIPAELADIFIKFADMPAEVIWFSITGFLFIKYF